MSKFFKVLASVLAIQMLAISPQVLAVEPTTARMDFAGAEPTQSALGDAQAYIDSFGTLYAKAKGDFFYKLVAFNVHSFIQEGTTLVYAKTNGSLWVVSDLTWGDSNLITTKFKQYFVENGWCYFTSSANSLNVVTSGTGSYLTIAYNVNQVFFGGSHVSFTGFDGSLWVVSDPASGTCAFVCYNATQVLMASGRMVYLSGSTLYEVINWYTGQSAFVADFVEQVIIYSDSTIRFLKGGVWYQF